MAKTGRPRPMRIKIADYKTESVLNNAVKQQAREQKALVQRQEARKKLQRQLKALKGHPI